MNDLATDKIFKGLSAELARHGERVTNHWNASRASLIDCGGALAEAKAALKHGEFEAMCERLPFGKSTRAMLMRVAYNLGSLNVQDTGHLPARLMVLDGLARLAADDLRRMFDDGLINPDMKNADLARFRRGQVLAELAAREQDPGPLNRGKKYTVIYADPAWNAEVWSQETGHNKSPECHYNTMTLDEIKALPVDEIAADDCVLFLWTTANRAHWAMEVLAAWGFEYKTQMVWDKEIVGTGRWVRDRHELLYIATRGKPLCPLPGDQDDSVYREKKGKHSAKPEYYRKLIERWNPGVAKMEMFARKPANDDSVSRGDSGPCDGWDVWGNQAGGGGKQMVVMLGGERIAVAGALPDLSSKQGGDFEGINMETGEIGSWPVTGVDRIEELKEGAKQ